MRLVPKARADTRSRSAFEFEDHVHGGFHFDGLLVEQVWTIAPGLDGIDRGLLQHLAGR